MKKIFKILFILFVLLLIFFGVVYIDYFVVKNRNTTPKIAIKKKISDNLEVYNATLYRVWYCKSNNTYILGNYDDIDPVCPVNYVYNNGFYENSSGVLISKRDLQLISNIYTGEMIENINSNEAVDNAVYVASEYGKILYKKVEVENNTTQNDIVIFPTYELVNNDYKWVYDNENYYCLNSIGEISLYTDGLCGEFKKIILDKKWCDLYKNSTLIYKKNIEELCQ